MRKRQRRAPPATPAKNPAAVALGRLGGHARAKTVLQTIPEAKRIMYARNAAHARWAAAKAEKVLED